LTIAAQSNPEDIDSWTRTFAEEQARQAGLPLREWLEQFAAEQVARAEGASLEVEPTPASAPSDPGEPIEPRLVVADDWLDQPFDVPEPDAEFEVVESVASSGDDDIPTDGSVVAHVDRDHSPPMEAAALTDPQDVEIELVLEDLLAQVDAVRDRMSARMHQGSVQRLDGIESALRRMREQLQAAEWGADVDGERAEKMGDAAELLDNPGPGVASMVKAVDSGVERIEAVGDRRMDALRGEIASMFESLAARIDQIERRSTEPATGIDTTIEIDSTAEIVCAAGVEHEPTAPAMSDFDTDLFDDPPEPVAAEIDEPWEIAAAAPIEAEALTAAPSLDHDSLDHDQVAWQPSAAEDLEPAQTVSEQPAPGEWEALDLEAGEGWPDEAPVVVPSTGQFAGPAKPKTSLFPWRVFGQGGLLRKSA
jgi:hypothetical protein